MKEGEHYHLFEDRDLWGLRNAPGIVIYQSSPVLAGADASLIGALTEQALLTVVAGHTTREQAKEAQTQLEQAHAKLVGAIMVNP